MISVVVPDRGDVGVRVDRVLLDRVAAALDERDASAHTGRTTEPEREPA